MTLPITHGRVYLAPMVQGSELAFRMLVRKYNDVNSGHDGRMICYSPMLRAKQVLEAHRYWNERQQTYDPREISFKELHEDAQLCLMDTRSDKDDAAHLVVQICGPCPVECKAATLALLELQQATPVAGIDFNLGCPQVCASRGGFGAFLAEESPDVAIACVKAIRDAIEEHHSTISCSSYVGEESSSPRKQRTRPRLSCKIRLQDTYATTRTWRNDCKMRLVASY
jgi:tRNA-dihydrouridine synthase